MWVLYKIFNDKEKAEKKAKSLAKHEPCSFKIEETNGKYAVYVRRDDDYWKSKGINW